MKLKEHDKKAKLKITQTIPDEKAVTNKLFWSYGF